MIAAPPGPLARTPHSGEVSLVHPDGTSTVKQALVADAVVVGVDVGVRVGVTAGGVGVAGGERVVDGEPAGAGEVCCAGPAQPAETATTSAAARSTTERGWEHFMSEE